MTKDGKGIGRHGGSEQEYEVGYARPPVHARFQPGLSGNPAGRPKGAKTRKSKQQDERLKELIVEEAYREVSVQDSGREIRMSVAQAAIRSLSILAAKGNVRAIKVFLELVQVTEASRREDREKSLEAAIGYKAYWQRELEHRKARGIIGLPEPIPHPDDIVIDFENDTVSIVGPMTKEEKAAYDRILQLREEIEEELRLSIVEIETVEDPEAREKLQHDIARCRRFLTVIDKKLGR